MVPVRLASVVIQTWMVGVLSVLAGLLRSTTDPMYRVRQAGRECRPEWRYSDVTLFRIAEAYRFNN